MKFEIKRRKCDLCGKVVDLNDMSYGNSPTWGWFELKEETFKAIDTFDFCGVPCLTAYLKNRAINPVEDPVPF